MVARSHDNLWLNPREVQVLRDVGREVTTYLNTSVQELYSSRAFPDQTTGRRGGETRDTPSFLSSFLPSFLPKSPLFYFLIYLLERPACGVEPLPLV